MMDTTVTPRQIEPARRPLTDGPEAVTGYKSARLDVKPCTLDQSDSATPTMNAGCVIRLPDGTGFLMSVVALRNLTQTADTLSCTQEFALVDVSAQAPELFGQVVEYGERLTLAN